MTAAMARTRVDGDVFGLSQDTKAVGDSGVNEGETERERQRQRTRGGGVVELKLRILFRSLGSRRVEDRDSARGSIGAG